MPMEFLEYESSESMGESASDFIVNEIIRRETFVLCAATGGSPTLTYRNLVKKRSLFSEVPLSVVKLDEWGGIAPDHPSTCETYLQKHLIQPLDIKEPQFLSFQSNAPDPEKECRRIQESLLELGKINICILGLGLNGHIAFNEPADYLQTGCHVAALSPSSQQHPMAQKISSPQGYGFTLGMSDILHAETIVFLVNGSAKKHIFREFMTRKITTHLPASFLWLHPNAFCFYTADSLY
jgi:galactosamine-6-phosphate isomerase